MEQAPFRILSLDGGGAKGFYTIGVLSEIEAMTARPICESFDLIFGTSTGSIIAALLARGDSVETVRKLYEIHVPTIMKGKKPGDRSKSLRKLADEIFKDDHYSVFKTDVGVVSTNWTEEMPLIFKTSVNLAHGSKATFDPFFGVRIADAIVASCSAYPFFEMHTITKSNGDRLTVVDGGFCANNPTLYAIADATLALGRAPSELRVVSLGVGSYPEPPFWKKAGRAILNIGLAKHALNAGFLQKVLGTNTCSMEVLRKILFKDVSTVRVSESFSEPLMATDLLECNPEKLNRLAAKGRMSFAKHETELRALLDLATSN